jgi:hypothetical protein
MFRSKPRPGFVLRRRLAAAQARLLVAASLAVGSLSVCVAAVLTVWAMRAGTGFPA